MHRIGVLAAIAGTMLCGTASAQDLTLELLQVEGITALNTFNPDSPELYIGTNPAAIAYDGNSLYVAGFNNSANTLTTNVVQIIDFLAGAGQRSFATVEGSEKVTPAFWYWAGLDWNDNGGLIASFNDFGGGQPQFLLFEDDGSGLTLDFTVGSIAGRGRSDLAWDAGFDGMGFPRAGGMGPVVAVLDNDTQSLSGFGIASIGQTGPIALDPTDNFAPVYFATDPPQTLDGPRLIPSNGDATGTLWRGLDMKGPWVAARADNDLIITERDANNSNVDEPTRVDMGSGAQVAGQNVVILDNQQCGDTFIMWNSRDSGSCSGSLTDVMQLSNTDGTPASYAIVDGNGDPVSFDPFNCYYSMYWDSDDQLLFICEFSTGIVYVLTPTCGEGPCNDADVAEPFGILDLQDISGFVGGFVAQDPSSDLNDDMIFDLTDVTLFVTAFSAGCP